ncbi:MAG TPA: CBS domain-containing protein [Anaerolineae bacterium]|nr:CBS domain-containing protein [Anaerolineae bacterium]
MEIVTSHENTDFDGLASMLGAVKLYPKAIPVLPQRLNRNLQDFLALYGDEFPFARREDIPRGRIRLMIVVDTQSIPSLKGLSDETEVRFIDHHPLERELGSRMTFHSGDVGSTTTLLVEQIFQSHINVSPVESTLLLLGIYEDTGSLSYPGTKALDARCAAWLLEQGANLEVVNEFLHRPLSESQRQLYRTLVEAAEFHEFSGHTVVVAVAGAEDYLEEISTLAHKLRDLYEPSALFLIVDLEANVQMVARSSSDAIDVAKITRHFGGGGHSKAAAALIRDRTVAETREQLLRVLESEVRPSTTVADLMSHGVYTLSPDTSVAEAAQVMRWYGHEGFPVVAEHGRVLGMLTRREIDKALQYERGDAAISHYMRKGEIVVAPSDPVEHLQDVMIQHDVGQVAVVEDGEIVGIVTRTDLIKLWSKPSVPEPSGHLAEQVRSALPPSVLDLLLRASGLASEMGFSLYVVGGFVRDLLLGKPHLDLDIVVEGDAIALARRLSEAVGGRVHSHFRFGTAKLIFDSENAAFPFVDFTTARREFYEYSTALPQVERSSIKQDLYRRDFTINTMAISLNEDTFGELLDFYGGERDLREGLVRVLHNLSFIEDPIRMLRAVRLEQRLGFRMEEMTEELISDALEWLDRVGGERIRQELYAVFEEDEPGKPLRRLSRLGILQQISPLLAWDDWLEQRVVDFHRAASYWQGQASVQPSRGADSRLPTVAMIYLALLSLRATEEEVLKLAIRLRLPKDDTQFLIEARQLSSPLSSLAQKDLSRSGIYRLLAPHAEPVIFLCWLASEDDLVKGWLELYHSELSLVKTVIDGAYLRSMGLPPGPLYTQILSELRDARLDRRVSTLEDEKEEVQRIISRTDTSSK